MLSNSEVFKLEFPYVVVHYFVVLYCFMLMTKEVHDVKYVFFFLTPFGICNFDNTQSLEDSV